MNLQGVTKDQVASVCFVLQKLKGGLVEDDTATLSLNLKGFYKLAMAALQQEEAKAGVENLEKQIENAAAEKLPVLASAAARNRKSATKR